MKHARNPKPATRLEPRRVELVRSTYQPPKAELEEPFALPQLSLEGPPAGSWNRSKFTTSTSPGARARRDAFGHYTLIIPFTGRPRANSNAPFPAAAKRQE